MARSTECIECGIPLFGHTLAPEETDLCDGCWSSIDVPEDPEGEALLDQLGL